MNVLVSFIGIVLMAFNSGCTGSSFSLPSLLQDPEKNPVTSPTFTSEKILDVNYNDGFVDRPYQLFKTQWGSESAQYMQWIPNYENINAGAVILYYPYEAISWTGLAVDTKWFGINGSAHADEDGPYYSVGVSSNIAVDPMSHQAAAGATVPFFGLNRLHILIVYGRYYAGSTPTQDIEAVQNAYRFLQGQSLVDQSKIGIYSGSWGGIGVLYGSAASSLKPKAISLAYPVSSPKDLNTYLESIPTKTSVPNVITGYETFFDPYKRRMEKATESLAGSPTRYNSLSHGALSTLNSNIFVIHDAWDTLVPLTQTEDLLSAVASPNKYTYIQRHTTPIDYDTFRLGHNQVSQPIDYNTQLTWTYAFLVTELTPETENRLIKYSSSIITAQFAHMKAMRDAGQDTTSFNKVLSLLCRPLVFVYDLDNSLPQNVGASALLNYLMNQYQLGWSADGPAACAKLQTNPPF